ncbi:hypothetical protein [Cochleicola gelatinilyticus]|uniref:Receptor L-domain domain-containing protein n=1 Tax=Cochleicola gelatinilyticus TaxID=1763537 RepID=A0A167K9M4_9FLAO|nr:hypothetical protein [Cochleicola gelatinilyticus]OAB81534.1 hypothetical protein ULVI_01565 [Cochleicola gelatinilyticus]
MIKFSTLIVLFCLLAGCSDDNSVVEEDIFNLSIEITSPFDIKGDIASSGGNIINEDDHTILRKGVCYSLTAAPTVNDLLIEHEGVATSFEVNLENLEFNTVYYARAFAETTNDIFYSDEVAFTTTNECTLNVFEGDVTLTTQTEVDDFASNNYCRITGYLSFSQENDSQDPIVDISAMSNIRSVDSFAVVNTNLESLEGMQNLSIVSSNIFIDRNNLLIQIDDLSNISSSLHSILLNQNFRLTNVNGLSNINRLVEKDGRGPYLKVGGADSLTSLSGLDEITFEDENGTLMVHTLPLITNLDVFSQISGKLSTLEISYMDNLQNIDGITSITGVNDSFRLTNNESLLDFSGLQNITNLTQNVLIKNNDNLFNLDDFYNLQEISGTVQIVSNEALVDFCGIIDAIQDSEDTNFEITGNQFNPTYQDLLDGTCTE